MRYFYSTLLAFLLSFNAMAELSQRHQKLADMLLSGEIRQVKVAAQQIYDEEISDPTLMDIAAEVLLTKYPHAYASEIDTVAWLARAIGASENDRYYAVLTDVINNTDNAKLERHAESGRDDLPEPESEQYVAGMYQLPENLYAKEESATRNDRIRKLMMAGDLSGLKQAAKEIVGTKTKSQMLTDIAAEILLTHYPTAQKHQIDTLAWLTNAIGSTGSARYVDALQEVEEKSDFRKLRNYAETNREKLGEPHSEQYKQGMLNKEIPSYDF